MHTVGMTGDVGLWSKEGQGGIVEGGSVSGWEVEQSGVSDMEVTLRSYDKGFWG